MPIYHIVHCLHQIQTISAGCTLFKVNHRCSEPELSYESRVVWQRPSQLWSLVKRECLSTDKIKWQCCLWRKERSCLHLKWQASSCLPWSDLRSSSPSSCFSFSPTWRLLRLKVGNLFNITLRAQNLKKIYSKWLRELRLSVRAFIFQSCPFILSKCPFFDPGGDN